MEGHELLLFLWWYFTLICKHEKTSDYSHRTVPSMSLEGMCISFSIYDIVSTWGYWAINVNNR
jgi:hypothetical protein